MLFSHWKQAHACLTACACAAVSLLSQPAFAESKPSVESFFADPAVYDVVISPKGEHVAILMKDPDGGELLAVRDTADLKNGKIVSSATSDDKILDIHWVNENRLTFTVRSGIHDMYEGNQDEIAVDRDGSNVVYLISGNFDHAQQSVGSHIRDKTLTADYAFAATLHDGSDDILVEKYSWKPSDPNHPDTSHLFRLNTRTRALSDVPVGHAPQSVKTWMIDVHGAPRIAISEAEGHCIINYRAPDKDEWEVLSNAGCYESQMHSLAFDGDNGLIVIASYKGHNALYNYDLKTRKQDDKPFLSLEGFDFAGSIETDGVTGKMVGIHYESDAAATVWLDPKYKQMQAKIDALLPQTSNLISCGVDCFNAPAVLVTSTSDRQPAQFYVYNIAKQSLVGLGGAHPDIKPAQMGLRDFYRFKARDGMSIPVYVTTPPGKPTQPLPTVVLVHGGPMVRGSYWEWENEAQFLASRGYLVIQPEFRGSMGFGYNLFHAGWKQWGQSMQDDLADAALWAVHEHNADPKRIAIMGASYGGYATLMGLIKNPEIFRCGVEWAGVTDSGLMFSLAESDFSQETMKYDLSKLMGNPDTDGEMFKKYSPLQNAAKLTQPLLVAHGADDTRVPIAQATAFISAVRATNPNVEWVVYNNERHGWHLEKDNIDFWKRVDAFLDKNLMHAQ